MNTRKSFLEDLNGAQRQAVECIEGPVLIVAGPGSGKTRVITHRIAYLVRDIGISPAKICSVTFTNRAAREMRSRLQRLLGPRAQSITAGTFHAFCSGILRREGSAIGIPEHFVIFDDGDQIDVIKSAMERTGMDPKRFPPRSLLSAISRAKSQLISPQQYLLSAGGYYDQQVQSVYAEYQALLARNHAVDFDDLLSKTVELFREAPNILNRYQERYLHLMVDEFQDTNLAQYQVANDLAGKYRNICVVGDPDQSIYAWRNADLRNILNFQRDYPDARVIQLSQNYRSSATILEASRKIIAANKQRLQQDLWTENPAGQLVQLNETYDEAEEALQVLNEVVRLSKNGGYQLRDLAVTYRVNAQSRALEEACLHNRIPYKLIGGVRFYHRREVKDVLAYLRLLLNPYDEVSLERVINVPPRGIGEKTVADLQRWAVSMGLPSFAAIQTLEGEQVNGNATPPITPLSERQIKSLLEFHSLMNALYQVMQSNDLPDLFDAIVEQSGYRRHILGSEDRESEERLQNLTELRGVAADFSDLNAASVLAHFLENVSLVTDQDSINDDEQQYLTLITLHQIKGLEYPVVFITGLEENLLPHIRSQEDADQLEEERRLLYVGMTRAMEILYLYRAFRRRLSGITTPNPPSRFLYDLPDGLVNLKGTRLSPQTDTWTPSFVGSFEPTAPEEIPFRTGDKVIHDTFGQGMVVSCVPKPGDYEITVVFMGDSGIKRLLHKFANLKKAD